MRNIQSNLFEDFDFASKPRFGKLVLTGVHFLKISRRGFSSRYVVAKCDCGVVDAFNFENIHSGLIACCGCSKEKRKYLQTGYSHSKHLLYSVYYGILRRCTKQDYKQYPDYGGRGVAICDEWMNDYFSFYNWAVANGWRKGLELDRIDNDGHYEPSNCRFVSKEINLRNTRRNVNITAWGETKCLWDWAKDPRCKVSYPGLRHRMARGKWGNMEDMISSPDVDPKEIARKSDRMLTAFGETKSLAKWVRDKRCKVKLDAFRDRLDAGIPIEDALTKVRIKRGTMSRLKY